MNFLKKSSEEQNLLWGLLKLGGGVMILEKGCWGLSHTPRTPKTHWWTPLQNKQIKRSILPYELVVAQEEKKKKQKNKKKNLSNEEEEENREEKKGV